MHLGTKNIDSFKANKLWGLLKYNHPASSIEIEILLLNSYSIPIILTQY